MTVIYARIERIRDTLLPKAKKATPSEQTLARLLIEERHPMSCASALVQSR